MEIRLRVPLGSRVSAIVTPMVRNVCTPTVADEMGGDWFRGP